MLGHRQRSYNPRRRWRLCGRNRLRFGYADQRSRGVLVARTSVERPKGIEPSPSVWKTEALPLSYGRTAAPSSCAAATRVLAGASRRRFGAVIAVLRHIVQSGLTYVLATAITRAAGVSKGAERRRRRTLAPSLRGVAQLGSALALGARGRGFKSRHPDRSAQPLNHGRTRLSFSKLARETAPSFARTQIGHEGSPRLITPQVGRRPGRL